MCVEYWCWQLQYVYMLWDLGKPSSDWLKHRLPPKRKRVFLSYYQHPQIDVKNYYVITSFFHLFHLLMGLDLNKNMFLVNWPSKCFLWTCEIVNFLDNKTNIFYLSFWFYAHIGPRMCSTFSLCLTFIVMQNVFWLWLIKCEPDSMHSF